jgi:hypothetical protein
VFHCSKCTHQFLLWFVMFPCLDENHFALIDVTGEGMVVFWLKDWRMAWCVVLNLYLLKVTEFKSSFELWLRNYCKIGHCQICHHGLNSHMFMFGWNWCISFDLAIPTVWVKLYVCDPYYFRAKKVENCSPHWNCLNVEPIRA